MDGNEERSAYESGWSKILELINTGGSWSGHERNSCFLNTGGERFADISAVAGLDFMDDGRCVGAVDWDFDGDLDLWLASRTGPRLRFVRNDVIHEGQGKDAHFIALRLRGEQCNRDAIGARVTAEVDGRPVIRTASAGAGYLTQASKWIHIGVGKNTNVNSVKVRWPGGDEETFNGVSVDGHWELKQGEGEAVAWQPPERTVQLTAQQVPSIPDKTASRVVLLDRLPVPTLTYEDFDGNKQTASQPGNPTLVNLWATWCQPCAVELKEMKEAEQRIRDAKLSIVALSVDGLGDEGDESSTTADAKTMMDNLKFPFKTGAANTTLLATMDAFQEVLISLRTQKDVVPTSFLLDDFGRLAVIYIGPVTVEQLLADVAMIQKQHPLSANPAFPFAGRWFAQPRQTGTVLLDMATEFEKRSMTTESMQFAMLAADLATRDAMSSSNLKKLADMFYNAGNNSISKDTLEDAKRYYAASVRLDPDRAETLSNLGSVCHQLGQTQEAKQHLFMALKINPRLVPPNMNLGIIFLEEEGYSEAITLFRAVIHVAPTSADAHNFLGLALARSGQTNKAVSHFESAIQYGNPSAQAHLQKVLKGERP